MPKSILFPIEPTILKYARKYSGYSIDEVSKKTKILEEKLQSYEEQRMEIPISQIEKLANLYKRPFAFFLLSKIPEGIVLPKDFRIVFSQNYKHEFSPKFYLAVRRARYVQSVLKDLSEIKLDYKLSSVSLSSEIEPLSYSFRKFIGIDLEKQKKWKNSSEALRNWKNSLEEKNIFIMQSNLSKDNISALCLIDEKPFIIILNSNEHEHRRIFSLFHEVGHILLRKSGVCNPDDLSRNSYEYIKIEKFCNQFAASLLLPSKEFSNDSSIVNLINYPISSWNEDVLKKISNKYKVSKEVILRRLSTLGYISEKDYEKWREKSQKEAEEFKLPEKKEFRIPQYIKCLSQNGRAITSFILTQYHSNKITFDAAAEILNIAPKHIPTLEMKVW